MFDFLKWREWLRKKSDELQSEGFSTEWKTSDKYLRGTALNVSGNSKIASFRNWENGFVDYEILDVESKEWIVNVGMVHVDDQNFVEVFLNFQAFLFDR